MSSNKKGYTKQARFLKRIGFNLAYKGNRVSTPSQRGAVTRLYNIYGGYDFKPETGKQIKFIKADKETRKGLTGVISKEQATPKGVILVVPKGVSKKDFKYKIEGKGENARLYTSISGQRADITIGLDPIALAKNPIEAVKKALAKIHPEAKQLKTTKILDELLSIRNKEVRRIDKRKKLPLEIKIIVAGNEQAGGNMFAAFFRYFNELYEGTSEGSKRNGTRMKDETFADLFHLKLIYRK